MWASTLKVGLHKTESAHDKMHPSMSMVIDFRRGTECIRICIHGQVTGTVSLCSAVRRYRYRYGYEYGYLRRGRQRSVVDSCRRRIYVSGTERSCNPNKTKNRNRRISRNIVVGCACAFKGAGAVRKKIYARHISRLFPTPPYLFVYLLFMIPRAEAEVEVFLGPRPAFVTLAVVVLADFPMAMGIGIGIAHSLIGIALGDSWRRRRISECI